MKKIARFILIAFLVLVVISGLLLFMFREQLADSLSNQANFKTNLNYDPSVSATAGDTLDLEVFKLTSFTSLVNNVINFNFDNICKRPSDGTIVVKTKIASTTDAESATSTTLTSRIINCVEGNNAPFLIKK